MLVIEVTSPHIGQTGLDLLMMEWAIPLPHGLQISCQTFLTDLAG